MSRCNTTPPWKSGRHNKRACLQLEASFRGQGSDHFDKLTVAFGINHLQCGVLACVSVSVWTDNYLNVIALKQSHIYSKSKIYPIVLQKYYSYIYLVFFRFGRIKNGKLKIKNTQTAKSSTSNNKTMLPVWSCFKTQKHSLQFYCMNTNTHLCHLFVTEVNLAIITILELSFKR